jgi:hypothetical protein
MVVKVYGPAMAVCLQRVMACLLEKGVEFDLVHVDLDSGEQKLPEFLLKQVERTSLQATLACLSLRRLFFYKVGVISFIDVIICIFSFPAFWASSCC